MDYTVLILMGFAFFIVGFAFFLSYLRKSSNPSLEKRKPSMGYVSYEESQELPAPSVTSSPSKARSSNARDEVMVDKVLSSKEARKMVNFEMLSESEVTEENILSLFSRAFMRTSLSADDVLIVETEGPNVLLTISKDTKILRFMSIYRINAASPLREKRALANQMNHSVVLVRFLIPEAESDVLIATYYLPYGQGIPTSQIVSTTRLFSRVVLRAIQAHDKNGLIE